MVGVCAMIGRIDPHPTDTGPMDRSRRTFLSSLAAWGIRSTAWLPISHGVRAGILGTLPAVPHQRVSQPTLAALLDTLIPDDSTPGAVAIGLLEGFMVRVAGDTAFRDLMGDACRWLDLRARAEFGAPFAELEAGARESIVDQAAGAPPRSMPREFFQAAWDEAVFQYYADPRSWPGLGFDRPPQPLGYPDHADAPARPRDE